MLVQSVTRAEKIRQELASTGPRLGVTEVAERIGVAKPTAHALLRTLEAEGLVVQVAEARKDMLALSAVPRRDVKVPARSGDAAAGQRLPRNPGAANPLARVGRRPRNAHEGSRVGRDA